MESKGVTWLLCCTRPRVVDDVRLKLTACELPVTTHSLRMSKHILTRCRAVGKRHKYVVAVAATRLKEDDNRLEVTSTHAATRVNRTWS